MKKERIYIFPLLFLMLFMQLYGKDSHKSDSLINILHEDRDPASVLKALKELAAMNRDKAVEVQYLTAMLDKASSVDSISMVYDALSNLSRHYYNIPDMDSLQLWALYIDSLILERKDNPDVYYDKNTNLLLNLVNDVLDLSRLEAGTTKLAIEPCELVGCCREALSNIRYDLSSDIKLTFDTSVGSFTIMTASQQLSQLISRLLDNAAKFTKEGEINLSLFVDEEVRIVRFTVTDTGPGIPLDKQEKIFERFEKLDEFSQGSGLGLTICRIIAEHLGGEVNIDPEYTNGARFVFTHPYIN